MTFKNCVGKHFEFCGGRQSTLLNHSRTKPRQQGKQQHHRITVSNIFNVFPRAPCFWTTPLSASARSASRIFIPGFDFIGNLLHIHHFSPQKHRLKYQLVFLPDFKVFLDQKSLESNLLKLVPWQALSHLHIGRNCNLKMTSRFGIFTLCLHQQARRWQGRKFYVILPIQNTKQDLTYTVNGCFYGKCQLRDYIFFFIKLSVSPKTKVI